MKITDIKINGFVNPLGACLDPVLLSWKVTETASKKASAVRIDVAMDEEFENVIWTKEDADLRSIGEKIDISPAPETAYYVRVAVTGDAGDSAEGLATFETGKMNTAWIGRWIAADKADTCHPIFRKQVEVKKTVRYARLYATGVGMFEAYVNGEKLGNEYLLPGVTNYESTLQVITFPVELAEGENTLELLAGKGWYMGEFGLDHGVNHFGDRMAVLAELVITYEDGTSERIGTDGSWTYVPSDIVDSGIYLGEIIDRTLNEADAPEKPVCVIENPEAEEGTKNLAFSHLADRLSPPIVVKEYLDVKEIITTPAGETVLDFGQNFAGFMEFDADFAKGTKIEIRCGEILIGGNFYNENLRGAKAELVYISGGEKETVRPHFTFYGFRYLKVEGWVGELKKEAFRGCVVYSDMERTGFLETGNPRVDRLYLNGLWGLKSNFLDMPTDCPQRDERLGWTGDAQVFSPTACYHMDTRAFYHKFEKDLRDEQVMIGGRIPNYVPNHGHQLDSTSVWGDIATFLPMVLYRYYGSREELAYAYPMMKDWVEFMKSCDTEGKFVFRPGFQFGDWLGLDGVSENSFKGGTEDGYLGDIYYYQSARYLSEAAEILGYHEDADSYGVLARNIYQALLNEYFTPNGRFALDTQASYIVALHFGVYIDKDRLLAQFRDRLAKDGYRIRCGFVGAPLLCTVLAECGLTDLAYDFLLKEGFPGWLYAVDKGATTIWERWNSVMPDGSMSPTGMNSLNHYSYGSVMEFLYAWAAGIRPRTPGFEKAILAPQPSIRLPKLFGAYDSVAGRYVSNTEILPDGQVHVHLEIPFGAEAEVTLPRHPEMGTVVLDAGSYDYTYTPTVDYRKPYSKDTMLCALAEDPAALGILFKLVPPIGGMAAGHNEEFAYATLDSFRYLSFLPIEPAALDQAIAELSDLIVKV